LASLSYGELCIEGPGTPLASLGDLYTFGSPRVGRGDFATAFRAAVSSPQCIGSSWRIVNHKDYVPKIPASPPWPFSRDPFVHVDAAYQISPASKPQKLPSEIGTHPSWSIPTAIVPHCEAIVIFCMTHQDLVVIEYCKSMFYASGVLLPNPLFVRTLNIHPLNISTQVDIRRTLATGLELNLAVELETKGDYVLGTMTSTFYGGHFVGEFTALGNLGKIKNTLVPFFVTSDNTGIESWKYLYSSSKESQCVFTHHGSDWKIEFVVDNVAVAFVLIPFFVSDVFLPHKRQLCLDVYKWR